MGTIEQALIGFAAGGTGLGVLVWMVTIFLKHLNEKDARSESVITAVVERQSQSLDKHTDSLNRLNQESSERSQSLENCMREQQKVVEAAHITIKEAIPHLATLKEYERQKAQRNET